MINLLPEKAKKEIRSGRLNAAIVKYIYVLAAAAGFLAVLCYGTQFIIKENQATAEQLIKINESNSNSSYSLMNQAKTMQSNITVAQNILNSQVLYSKILIEVGRLLPSGVVLDSIALTNSKLSTPINLKLLAKSSDTTEQIKASFERSSIFSRYTMQSVANEGSGDGNYPVSINATVTINRSAVK